jgi:hypothetical protein
VPVFLLAFLRQAAAQIPAEFLDWLLLDDELFAIIEQ